MDFVSSPPPPPSSMMMVTTASLFGRLDPILKLILENLTDLKSLLPQLAPISTAATTTAAAVATSEAVSRVSSSSSSSLSSPSPNGEEKFVRLMNKIALDLELLSQAMVKERPTSSSSSSSSSSKTTVLPIRVDEENGNKTTINGKHELLAAHANALCVLVDYVTLPLTAVFHLPLKEILSNDNAKHNNNNNNNNDGDGDDDNDTTTNSERSHQLLTQKIKIRRSYIFKLYRAAALAMQTYVKETTLLSTTSTLASPKTNNLSSTLLNNNDNNNNNNNEKKKNILKNDCLIKYLIALVNSMPSYANIVGHNTNCDDKHRLFSSSFLSSSLDDGSDSWVTILDTVRLVIIIFDDKDDDSNLLLLFEAWHGTLLMRLVDSLTAFIYCNSHIESKNTTKNTMIKSGHRKRSNRLYCFPSRVHRAALKTLLSLLQITIQFGRRDSNKHSQSSLFWRSVFPGVFTSLYQRAIEAGGSPSSSSFLCIDNSCQSVSLQCLVMLLRIGLCPSSSTIVDYDNKWINRNNNKDGVTNVTCSNNNQDLLLKLTSMVAAANVNMNTNDNDGDVHQNNQMQRSSSLTEKGDSDDEFHLFISQVRKRIFAPMIILLRQMSTSSSADVRKQTLKLCRVILFETPRYCWQQQQHEEKNSHLSLSSRNDDENSEFMSQNSKAMNGLLSIMEQIPFELCIALQRDSDETVREFSKIVVKKYLGICNGGSNDDWINERTVVSSDYVSISSSVWIISRIIEIVQKLAALVQGKNSNNKKWNRSALHSELKLLDGYLQCLVDNINFDEEKENDTLGSALVSSTNFRRSLIEIFDADLDSLTNERNMIPVVKGTAGDVSHQVLSSLIQFRYLVDSNLASLGKTILHSLGKILGVKYGAIFVDEVLSDFLEDSLHVPAYDLSSYAAWIHQWIGAVYVARGVVFGTFSTVTQEQRQQKRQRARGSLFKEEKRRRRILISLASSILPLLVDSSPWHLPTDNRTAVAKKTPLCILEKNNIVVVLLLELVRTFCGVLDCDVESFLSTILYPIVDKTSHGSASGIIQNSGLSTLHVMSVMCKHKSTEDMISTKQNQLVASMVGRLRLSGGSKIPSHNDAEEILSVINTANWTLKMIIRNTKGGDKEGTESHLRIGKSSIVDLISLMDYRLDHLFLQKVLADDDVITVLRLHKAFFDYFLFVFRVKRDYVYSYQMRNVEKDSKEPWLDELSKFLKVPALDSSKVIGTENLEGNQEAAISVEENCRLLDINETDLTLFSKLIARDCYLLSSRKLESRISACDALTIAFKFLAFVGSIHDDPKDEKSVIKNSILRQVADCWPVIRARIRTISEEILSCNIDILSLNIVLPNIAMSPGNGNDRNSLNGFRVTDTGTQRIFLTKLFSLIGTMCECSGDFFCDRFRNDVWPVMASHFEILLQKLQPQFYVRSVISTTIGTGMQQGIVRPSSSISSSRAVQEKAVIRLSETEKQFIIAIITCLKRVFQQQDCGKAVQNLLTPIGFTLIPFLDDVIEDDFSIQELTMDCVKSILRIDCNILMRPLIDLSCSRIPSCPLLGAMVTNKCNNDVGETEIRNSPRKIHNPSIASSHANGKTNISTRCKDLLDFIETLPEQSL